MVGDEGGGRVACGGSVVFDREKFESAFTLECSDKDVDLTLPSVEAGHYSPASAFSRVAAFGWVPYADALAAVRALLGVSHKGLQPSAHKQLCNDLQRSCNLLNASFFDCKKLAAAPFAAGDVRFPDHGLFVCVDLPPLGPALQAVQRSLMQVSVKGADLVSSSSYLHAVYEVWQLLVGEPGNGGAVHGPVAFGRDKFESHFAIEWVVE